MRRFVVSLVAGAALAGCTSGDLTGQEAAESTTATATASPTTASTDAPPTTATPTTTVPTTTTPTTTAPPVATTLVPHRGPLFGIAVPKGRIETIEAIEASAGSRFHLVRVFTRWEDDLATDTDIAAIQAGGRAVHLSVRPTRNDGTPIPWSDIAMASEGSALHDEMVAWADAVVALGPDLRFTFNHEPETKESAPSGQALEYREAWRRMVELIRERGGENTTMVWTVGREALTGTEGSEWYPGDDVVDVIGADLYNWYTCQGTDRPWTSFETLIEPAIEFAEARAKPLAVPEFASAADPDDLDRRAGWMDAAVDTMIELVDDPNRTVELDYVAWFDVTAPGGTNPDCQWEHTTDDETSNGFMRMIRDLVGS